MKILQIIILGIVQGIAEFLPISSSAHLIIFRDVFGIGAGILSENADKAFDIALHLGTLLAIFVFFFKDILKLLKEGLTKGTKTKDGRLFWYLILATIPAGIFGVLLDDKFEDFFRSKYILIAIALIVMGIILYLFDHSSKNKKDVYDITLKDALVIGFAQVFALIPGFSRSGTTITAARGLEVDRKSAAKFSFFLSIPVVGGAAMLSILKHHDIIFASGNILYFVIGVLSAFITGLICIKYLLKYLDKHDFKIFMIYRIAIAILVILMVVL